ncbi:hypothetical protein HY498_04900 [Candidatus Woesearchaeota archaeon]|nr:hypothetical protein [Candidatus Woesearchaeota archaeon]
MIKRGKKGAIELSMTTIIIIIVGVTLLSLSLVWIRGVIQKVTQLSGTAFETAEGEIGKLSGVSQLLTLSPTNIDLSQNSAKPVDVIIANFENNPITISAKSQSGDPKLSCTFADQPEKKTQSRTYTLGSGKQVKVKLIAEDVGSKLGINHCVITVSGTGVDETTETLIVNIIPKRGVFG